MSTPDRVAVVVVHGIADQRAGQTVRELARLLCHGGEGEPRYVQGEMHEVLVPVAKLEPGGAASPAATHPSPGGAPGTETSRRRPGTPSGFYQTQKSAPAVGAAESRPPDLGLALNDYLLGRLELPEREALYESTRVSLRRRANDRPVDIFELYWADLSRLGEGGFRALSALYQLFFHLGTLAADVVDQVSLSVGSGAAWRLLQRLHAWLAWWMKGPAALVQLSMLLLVLFGAAGLVSIDQQAQVLAALFAVGALVLSALAVLAWLRGTSPAGRWVRLVVLLAAALACSAAVVVALRAETELPVMHFTAGVLAVAVLGAWLIERYARVTHGVRVLGHLLVVATVIALWLDGRALLPHVSTQAEWMLTAAFNVGEWLLATLMLVWAVYVVVQTAALVLGLWLGCGVDRAARQSLNTARLAVVGSTALFAVLSLVLWSVISYVAGHQLNDFLYLPVTDRCRLSLRRHLSRRPHRDLRQVFHAARAGLHRARLGRPAGADALAARGNLSDDERRCTRAPARGRRVVGTTRPMARERSQTTDEDVRPGGAARRNHRRAAVPGVRLPAILLGRARRSLGQVGRRLAGLFAGRDLVSAGKWLAGGALTIAALGSRFTRTFGRLRVTLDAVLDVDNYFRDPPNRQPPRARIYSRYASLLVYLRDHGYARVVIVSHSQGTVISADLLRYLHVQRRLPDVIGDIPIALVTVGSPLRDLYAEHFPAAVWLDGLERRGLRDRGTERGRHRRGRMGECLPIGRLCRASRLGAAGRFVSHRADRIGWQSRSRPRGRSHAILPWRRRAYPLFQ